MIAGRTAQRSHLVLDPCRCALIVIDMMRYFADPAGAAWLPASEAVKPSIIKLIDCWRGFGGSVVFTRHCHESDDDGGMLGRFWSSVIRCDDPDSALVLEPLPDEKVLRKTTYDSFYGTGLEQHLRSRSISQVLITGVMTHLCCETTARSAFVRGFEVYAAVDAMATSSEELHAGSIRSMADGVGVMLDTDSVLKVCRE
jgi:isochorismate hydrolase